MDSFKSRVNFCLLRSSLGIHLFRDCHFLSIHCVPAAFLRGPRCLQNCILLRDTSANFSPLVFAKVFHAFAPSAKRVAFPNERHHPHPTPPHHPISCVACHMCASANERHHPHPTPPHHPISCVACHMCASANERHHPHPTPPHHPISCVACHMCASANERHHPHPTPPHHPISCVACHMCASANERHHPHPTPPPTLTSRSINFMSYEHHAYDLIRATTKTCKFHGAVPTSWAKTTQKSSHRKLLALTQPTNHFPQASQTKQFSNTGPYSST